MRVSDDLGCERVECVVNSGDFNKDFFQMLILILFDWEVKDVVEGINLLELFVSAGVSKGTDSLDSACSLGYMHPDLFDICRTDLEFIMPLFLD